MPDVTPKTEKPETLEERLEACLADLNRLSDHREVKVARIGVETALDALRRYVIEQGVL